MTRETQIVVDMLDKFRACIVTHAAYETQDLIHYLAVAADIIEEMAGTKEQLDGMEIMLTNAHSTIERLMREREAAVHDLKEKRFGCDYCKHYMAVKGRMCALPIGERKSSFECWEWRGFANTLQAAGWEDAE